MEVSFAHTAKGIIMIILPAIDLKDGNCVRLQRGDYNSVHKVAEDAQATAVKFKNDGAEWLHMVDLDGAKDKTLKNAEIILSTAKSCDLKVEVGGGIRDLKSIEYYLENGISRVIIGSAAVKDPDLVKEAVKRYGDKIAVGLDARNGKVAVEGWLDTTDVNYIELAKKMEDMGVKYLIFTDISKDGMLSGPNIMELYELSKAVSCNIIASGGVSNLDDVKDLYNLDLYGVICGKALYTGDLSLHKAVKYLKKPDYKNIDVTEYFKKSELIPAVVQEYGTNEILMLAYMNEESLQKTLKTGFTWFYSRSRRELWNKGATSGHIQKVISINSDCDNDTLLVKVIQTGNACHTGSKSCFFNRMK